MKISPTFHASTFLTIVLVFSLSYGSTHAQQDSIEVQAKMAAERDAKTDVNRALWFIAGAGASSSGMACSGLVLIGNACNASLSSSSTSTSTSTNLMFVILGGGLGASIPFIYSYGYQPVPPPERFIGKSPEYIDFYTDTYKRKTRQLRTTSTAMGAVLLPIGCLFYIYME